VVAECGHPPSGARTSKPPFGLARRAALRSILGVIMCRPEVSLATGSDASTPCFGASPDRNRHVPIRVNDPEV